MGVSSVPQSGMGSAVMSLAGLGPPGQACPLWRVSSVASRSAADKCFTLWPCWGSMIWGRRWHLRLHGESVVSPIAMPSAAAGRLHLSSLSPHPKVGPQPMANPAWQSGLCLEQGSHAGLQLEKHGINLPCGCAVYLRFKCLYCCSDVQDFLLADSALTFTLTDLFVVGMYCKPFC